MGGLALKTCYTRRFSKEEFEKITPEILEKAKMIFSDVVLTTSYRNKDSFGDADILCLIDNPINIDIETWIYDNMQSKEVFKNGHVYSFEYKELQVDFILTPKKYWNTSIIYFSYNDLHNLVGKISHRFGLKWGHKGLVYNYKIDDKSLREIIITTDHRKALSFLGFDPDRYDRGFNNIDEIFDFIITSKYFNPWNFDLANLNKINRDRDKKRKTYNAFLEKIEHLKNEPNDKWYYFHRNKEFYLGLVDYHFPGFMRKYRDLEKLEEEKRYIHSLFNGNLIMQYWPELKGKDLGNSISKFYSYYASKEDANNKILELNDTDQIMSLFARINELEFKSIR